MSFEKFAIKRFTNLSAMIASLCLSGAFISNTPNAIAAEETVNINHLTTFNVRFGKISVGEMNFKIKSDQKTYVLTGGGRTKGIAEWFASGNASLKSTGSLTDTKANAQSHSLSVSDKKKTATLNMALNNGSLKSVAMKPDKTKKHLGKKYVTIKDNHLLGIIDPASTLVIPVPYEKAGNPKEVCNQLHRVYDGETRYDMQLSYKKNAAIKTNGYNGNAYVCRLKYKPIAGHKTTNRNAKRMAANNDMEIWLAPMQATNIFTPIRIKIPTWVGNFYADPVYFGPAK